MHTSMAYDPYDSYRCMDRAVCMERFRFYPYHTYDTVFVWHTNNRIPYDSKKSPSNAMIHWFLLAFLLRFFSFFFENNDAIFVSGDAWWIADGDEHFFILFRVLILFIETFLLFFWMFFFFFFLFDSIKSKCWKQKSSETNNGLQFLFKKMLSIQY